MPFTIQPVDTVPDFGPPGATGAPKFSVVPVDTAPDFGDAPTATSGPGAFSRGFVHTLLQENPGALADALEGASYLFGDQDWAGGLRDTAGRIRSAAQAPEQYAPQSGGLGDLWDNPSIGRALTYLGESAGSAIGSTLPSMAGGTAGAIVGGRLAGKPGAAVGAFGGATVPSAGMNYGGMYRALVDEGVKPEVAAKWAGAAAVPITALDVAPVAGWAERIAGQGAKQEVQRAFAKRILQEALKGGLAEGLTEGAQQVIQERVAADVTGRDFWTPERMRNILDNAIGGALAGGAFGGASGIRRDQATPAPQPEPEPVKVEPLALPAPSIPMPDRSQPPPPPQGLFPSSRTAGALPSPERTYGEGFTMREGRPGEGYEPPPTGLPAPPELLRLENAGTPLLPAPERTYGSGFSVVPVDTAPDFGEPRKQFRPPEPELIEDQRTPAQRFSIEPVDVAPDFGNRDVQFEDVVSSIHKQESGGRETAKTSVTGARGGMQIQPATFAQYARPGESIDRPSDNIAVGRRIIADLWDKSGGDPARVAVGYFSGPGNIAPAGAATPWKRDAADPTGKTTSSYVEDVLKRLGRGGLPWDVPQEPKRQGVEFEKLPDQTPAPSLAQIEAALLGRDEPVQEDVAAPLREAIAPSQEESAPRIPPVPTPDLTAPQAAVAAPPESQQEPAAKTPPSAASDNQKHIVGKSDTFPIGTPVRVKLRDGTYAGNGAVGTVTGYVPGKRPRVKLDGFAGLKAPFADLVTLEPIEEGGKASPQGGASAVSGSRKALQDAVIDAAKMDANSAGIEVRKVPVKNVFDATGGLMAFVIDDEGKVYDIGTHDIFDNNVWPGTKNGYFSGGSLGTASIEGSGLVKVTAHNGDIGVRYLSEDDLTPEQKRTIDAIKLQARRGAFNFTEEAAASAHGEEDLVDALFHERAAWRGAEDENPQGGGASLAQPAQPAQVQSAAQPSAPSTEQPAPITTTSPETAPVVKADEATPKQRPSLGSTVDEVMNEWKKIDGDWTKRTNTESTVGRMIPGGTFDFQGGKIWRLEPATKKALSSRREATDAEIREIRDAIESGSFQIETRQNQGVGAGYREFSDFPNRVFHQATGRALEGTAAAKRQAEEDARRQSEKPAGNGKTAAPTAAENTIAGESAPYTLDEHSKVAKRILSGDITAEELKATYARFAASKESIAAELNKRTLKQLAPGGTGGRTKKDIVSSIVDRLASRFIVAGSFSWSPFSETQDAAYKRHVDATTDEQIKAAADKRAAAIEGRKKALTNPETLSEFSDFVDAKGEDALSKGQRAKYDELRAEQEREAREREKERSAVVKPADIGDTEMEIVETKHTKKGTDLFVVKLSQRVDGDVYKDLLAKAKRLGGYYSAFRGNGAVPGFQFPTRDAAEKFTALKEGAVSVLDSVKAREEQSQEGAVSRMRDMADRMEATADESLSRDRNANTDRRARMAASAEEQARAQKAMAQTMRNLADAIESGEATHLFGIRHAVDIETIDGILRQAHYEWARSQDKAGKGSSQKLADSPVTDDAVEFASYPYPRTHVDNMRGLAEAGGKLPGVKRAAARLAKLTADAEKRGGHLVELKTASEIDDGRVLAVEGKAADSFAATSLHDDIKKYDRMQRMGLTDLPTLRAALREYLKYRGVKASADPIVQRERALLLRQKDNWYATPERLAQRMVDASDLKSGARVLEPSAGTGRIADAAAGIVGKDKVEAVETSREAAQLLTDKGYAVIEGDFLKQPPSPDYDAVLMNPPFKEGADIDHVRHAWGFVKPGGKLVAVMSEGPFFWQDKKATEFRAWLESVGGESEKLPDGTFKESGTGVATRLVTIEKDGGGAFDGDLPMDEASRMARAKEMGFDKTPVYHGSPDFRSVKADNKFEVRERSEYNVKKGEFEKVKQPIYFAKERRIAASYADDRRAFDYQNAEPEVFVGHVRLKNPLRINAKGRKFSELSIESVRSQMAEDKAGDFDRVINEYVGDRSSGNIKTGDVEVVAQKLGYDGFIIENVKDTYDGTGKPGQIVAVFDPSNIRSVSAKFDPAKSDSADLSASRFGTWRSPRDRDRIAKRVVEIVRQIAPQTNVEIANDLSVRVGGRDLPGGGQFDPVRNLVTVALNFGDPEVTAGHEAVHALRSAGLFTDQEWATLEKAAKDRWIDELGVRDIYRGVSDDVVTEEAIAQRFAEWRKQPSKELPPVRRAFTKIRDFFRRLANALRGMGFRTAEEDVLEAVNRGEVGRRDAADTRGTEPRAMASKDLPMDEASRMARAEEQGFRTAAFHGTTADIDKFERGVKRSSAASAREGLWFTDSPHSASEYASGMYNVGADGGNVIPVRIREGKQLEIDAGSYDEGLWALTIRSARQKGYDSVRIKNGALKDIPYEAYGDYRNGKFGKDYVVVFDPVNIRSRFAKFDPDRTNSADLLASRFDAAPDESRASLWNTLKTQAAPAMKQPAQKPGTNLQQSAVERIFGTGHTPFRERVRASIHDYSNRQFLKAKQAILDQFASVKALERETRGETATGSRSPYKSIRLTRNLHSVMAYVLRHGPIAVGKQKDGGVWFGRLKGWDKGGFEDIFKPIADKGLLDLWKGWAVAVRADRLMREGRENLMTRAEINALLPLGRQYPEFAAAHKKWQAFNTAMLDMAEASGLVNAEQRALWENADYIPFFRVMEDEVFGPGRGKSGVANQRSGIRKLKGGTAQLNDPIENMVMNMTSLVDRSFKNLAARKVVALALEAGVMERERYDWRKDQVTPEDAARELERIGVQVTGMTPQQHAQMLNFWRMQAPTDPNVISVMVGGKPQFFRVHDPMLLQSLTSMTPQQLTGVLGIFRAAKRLLTEAITIDPAFMAANGIRDTLAAYVTTGQKGFTPFIDSMRGFAKALKEDDPTKLDIMANGGGLAGFYGTSPEDARKYIERHVGRLGVESIMDTPRKLWEGWHKIGQASESANRIAIAEAVKKDSGSEAEQAYQAMDLLDFGMRGASATMRILIETIPFLNARVQGLYRLGRGAKENPKAFLLRGSIIAAASLALLAENWDNPEYEKLEDWDKDTYWHLWVDGVHLRLPKPFEVGALFGTIPERMARAYFGKDDMQAAWKATKFMLQSTFQIDMPQLFAPLVEQWANRDTFTGRAIVGADLEKLPAWMQYRPDTSATAVEAGAALNKVLPKELESLSSPERIEHLVGGYFGTLGTYLLTLSDQAVRLAGDYPSNPTLRIDDIPVVKRFVRADPQRNTRFVTEFYDLKNEVDKTAAAVRELGKRGETDDAEKYVEGRVGDLAAAKVLDKAAKAMTKLRLAEQSIMRDRQMTPAQKRKAIDEITTDRNAMAEEFVGYAKTLRVMNGIANAP